MIDAFSSDQRQRECTGDCKQSDRGMSGGRPGLCGARDRREGLNHHENFARMDAPDAPRAQTGREADLRLMADARLLAVCPLWCAPMAPRASHYSSTRRQQPPIRLATLARRRPLSLNSLASAGRTLPPSRLRPPLFSPRARSLNRLFDAPDFTVPAPFYSLSLSLKFPFLSFSQPARRQRYISPSSLAIMRLQAAVPSLLLLSMLRSGTVYCC